MFGPDFDKNMYFQYEYYDRNCYCIVTNLTYCFNISYRCSADKQTVLFFDLGNTPVYCNLDVDLPLIGFPQKNDL